jgi:hypothetical protein
MSVTASVSLHVRSWCNKRPSRPVQFEITESTRTALADRIARSSLAPDDFLFPSRVHASPHVGTRQYARIVDCWVEEIGLDPVAYGTQSIRRTKPSLIYRRTKNVRAVHLLLGHTNLEGTVRYLGIEVGGRLGVGGAHGGVTLPRLSPIDHNSEASSGSRRPSAAARAKWRSFDRVLPLHRRDHSHQRQVSRPLLRFIGLLP